MTSRNCWRSSSLSSHGAAAFENVLRLRALLFGETLQKGVEVEVSAAGAAWSPSTPARSAWTASTAKAPAAARCRFGNGFGGYGRGDEDRVTPDDRGRIAPPGDLDSPLDVFAIGEMQGSVALGDAVVMWAAPLVP